MSGDAVVTNLCLRAGLLGDIAVSLRATAVACRVEHSRDDISTVLSTLANKMELKAESLLADAREMAR